jgi:hypothetical protein
MEDVPVEAQVQTPGPIAPLNGPDIARSERDQSGKEACDPGDEGSQWVILVA